MARQQERSALDETDLALVAALREAPDLTVKALAHRLGLPESTAAYRIRALKERGVLRGTRLQVDLGALGRPLEAIVKVRLQSHSREIVSQLYAELVAIPGVLQAFHVAGADDFHLHVAVADAQALRDLVLEHVTTHRAVRATETHLVFEVREGTAPLR
ncbi:MAG TPA: Lrp/AsnC family transcriptional regulator [Dermatophilaceae bacterium]|nr:Lrp/AsnC family transcriptional regulator [Dermatophilaceae bacterium]